MRTKIFHRTIALVCFLRGAFVSENPAREIMKTRKVSLILILVLAGSAVTAAVAIAASKVGPGECGAYKYWNKRECLDARNRPSAKTWAEEMLAKKWGP